MSSKKGKQRKVSRYKEGNEPLSGGLSDGMCICDIAKHHNLDVSKLKIQLNLGTKVEMEHTDDVEVAKKVALDHLYEIPDYYTRLAKMEDKAEGKEGDVDEMMSAGGSGSFEGTGAFGGTASKPMKRPIGNIQTMNEAAPESSGQYDAPAFVGTSKDKLKIAGIKAIEKRAKSIEKDKTFPKFGGPDAVFIKPKDKCKTFPYCNQGTDNFEVMKEDVVKMAAGVSNSIDYNKELQEAIDVVSKKRGIPRKDLEKLVLNEVKVIFI